MIKSLDQLPPASDIFIDSNIFLYDILGYPRFRATCMAFLEKIEARSYQASTSSQVLNEVVHKLILAEVSKIYQLRSKTDTVKFLKERPDALTSLSQVWKDYAKMRMYPLVIYGIDAATMDLAVELSNKHGLLISDATHIAVMKAKGIANIATNDGDFKRIDGIDVYKP